MSLILSEDDFVAPVHIDMIFRFEMSEEGLLSLLRDSISDPAILQIIFAEYARHWCFEPACGSVIGGVMRMKKYSHR
jgi:hypothetical protein